MLARDFLTNLSKVVPYKIRTIKQTTVKRCHYGSHDELRQHLQNLAIRAKKVYPQPTPSNAGTKQLDEDKVRAVKVGEGEVLDQHIKVSCR